MVTSEMRTRHSVDDDWFDLTEATQEAIVAWAKTFADDLEYVQSIELVGEGVVEIERRLTGGPGWFVVEGDSIACVTEQRRAPEPPPVEWFEPTYKDGRPW